MAGSSFGTIFKITTWGESHGKGLGVVVDGCPAGLPLDENDIQKFLNRRKPGQSKFTTPRKEDDAVEILSGVFEEKQPVRRSLLSCTIRTRNPKITVRLRPITVRDMRTILSTRNTVSAITAAADVPPGARRSDVLQPVRSLSKY